MPTLLEVSQTVSHWELCKMIKDVPGAIVECGVFKGRTLLRLAYFRHIFQQERNLIGFDTFAEFPEATGEDAPIKQRFIEQYGDKSLSLNEISTMLGAEGCADQLVLVQ